MKSFLLFLTGSVSLIFLTSGCGGGGSASSTGSSSALSISTIAWPAPTAITYGTALSSTQLNATATDGGTSIPGAFAYSPTVGTVLGAGTQTLSVTFTPANTSTYTTATATTSLTVNKATPTVAWNTPGAVTVGADRKSVV